MPFFCTVSSSKVSRKRLMASAKRCSKTCDFWGKPIKDLPRSFVWNTISANLSSPQTQVVPLELPGKTKGWYACSRNKAAHWNSSIPVQNLHRINPWKPEHIAQQVPTNEQTKFPKLLICGFKQCWIFPGWAAHHPTANSCATLCSGHDSSLMAQPRLDFFPGFFLPVVGRHLKQPLQR